MPPPGPCDASAAPVDDTHAMIAGFIAGGGCTFAIVALTLQLLLYAWLAYVTSNTLAEALHVSSLRGFATISIIVVLPVVIVVAAQLASR